MVKLRDGLLLRAVVGAAATCAFIALAIAINEGIAFRLFGLHVRAHNLIAPWLGAILLAAAAMLGGPGALRLALSWWWSAVERRAAAIAIVLAGVAVAIGINWGTFAAGGSDSYCYLNQAELFARGQARDFEALATDPSWPGTPGAFVPAGHSASPAPPGAFVPICPAGYPLMLAATRALLGREAMFWVTPLFGALAVWLAFALGRRVGGPAAGILAAALTVTSPIVLFQVVQPMNDVMAMALWAGALLAAIRPDLSDRWRGLLSGFIAGLALTVRPNLLPLAVVTGLCAAAFVAGGDGLRLGRRVKTVLAFGAAAVPGVLVVLAVQSAMYGGPLRSGYGDLGALFSFSHVVPNLSRYARWTLEAHTPLIALAFAGPLVLHAFRREAAWLILFALATLACYLPYVVFEDWWYQRFLLPGILPLLALAAAVIVRSFDRLGPAGRMVALFVVCSILPLRYLHAAVEKGAFGLRTFEARYRDAGEYAARLPPHSVFITGHQTGSLRFYSGRSTAGWGDIEPGRLEEAVQFFGRHGLKPYLLFESWEEPLFRKRFQRDKLGGLEWPPIVDIDRTVRIYDPADYQRYMRGEFVPTERIIKRR